MNKRQRKKVERKNIELLKGCFSKTVDDMNISKFKNAFDIDDLCNLIATFKKHKTQVYKIYVSEDFLNKYPTLKFPSNCKVYKSSFISENQALILLGESLDFIAIKDAYRKDESPYIVESTEDTISIYEKKFRFCNI